MRHEKVINHIPAARGLINLANSSLEALRSILEELPVSAIYSQLVRRNIRALIFGSLEGGFGEETREHNVEWLLRM